MEKETIELVKKMIEDGNLTQEAAEKYIPGLKEYNEDKKMKEYLIRHFELKLKGAEEQEAAGIDRSKSIETYKKAITWIKKKINSNQWKPDLIELEELRRAAYLSADFDSNTLKNLYQQLKVLTE